MHGPATTEGMAVTRQVQPHCCHRGEKPTPLEAKQPPKTTSARLGESPQAPQALPCYIPWVVLCRDVLTRRSLQARGHAGLAAPGSGCPAHSSWHRLSLMARETANAVTAV